MKNKNKRKNSYRNKYTKHHLIPSSRGWVWSHDNIKYLKQWVHRGIHQVFENALPHEQAGMLFELNESALSPEVMELVKEVKARAIELLKDKKFYKPNCYNKLKT